LENLRTRAAKHDIVLSESRSESVHERRQLVSQ
jgi:hypothetical protein